MGRRVDGNADSGSGVPRELEIALRLPATTRGRLMRSVLLSLLLLTIVLAVTWGAFGSPGASMLAEWPLATAALLFSAVALVVVVVKGGFVRSASTFYLLEEGLQLPATVGLLAIGVGILMEWSPAVSVAALGAGFIIGLAGLSRRIRDRRASIRSFYLPGIQPVSAKDDVVMWDISQDETFIRKGMDSSGGNPISRALFWLGPAVGMAISGLLGRPATAVFVGLGLAGVGYFLLVLKIDVAVSYCAEIRSLSRRTGKVVYTSRSS
jgi:hypothetical protein